MSYLDYQRNGETIEVVIRDYSGAKIESLKCNAKDKKKYKSILKYLDDKYGFKPEIDIEESINAKNDLDWWS